MKETSKTYLSKFISHGWASLGFDANDKLDTSVESTESYKDFVY